MLKKWLLIIILLVTFSGLVFADATDYLILKDIGSYQFKTESRNPVTKKVKQIAGYVVRNAAGILAGADHFDIDHDDAAYEIVYESDLTDLGVRVQVTQHTNSDSDMWLLHEVDAEFRNYYGIPGLSYSVKKIDGNTILQFSSGGRDYRWISGNKVIKVEYHDAQMTKPEPLEIVKAYLAKHPSTIQPFTLAQLRSTESKTKWIKDEMDRRLWICDKWFYQLQLGKVALKDVIWNTVRSMTVFLNYREKYYGIDAENDLAALNSYQRNNDGSSIKLKLQEYKEWWLAHKGKGIRP